MKIFTTDLYLLKSKKKEDNSINWKKNNQIWNLSMIYIKSLKTLKNKKDCVLLKSNRFFF